MGSTDSLERLSTSGHPDSTKTQVFEDKNVSDGNQEEKSSIETPKLHEDNDDIHEGLRLASVVIALSLCVILTGLDMTLLATAVPVITSEFNSLNDVGWYATAFFIATCASQPLAGKGFILWPKLHSYTAFIVVFEVGSLVCALATSSKALIIGRAVCGLGASGLLGCGMALLSTITPVGKRPVYIGFLTAAFSLSTIIGPPIGGILTQRVTWRWCFYINLPIGGFAAALLMLVLRVKASPMEKLSIREKLKMLDLVGFTLFSSSIIMLLLALQWGGNTYSWASSVTIGLIVGSGATMVAFSIWCIYQKDSALIPPSIFRQRLVLIAFLGALLANGGYIAIVYYLPIWFQAVLEATPEQSGTMFLPTVISTVITSLSAGYFVTKLGYWNPLLLLGAAFMAISSGLLTTLTTSTNEGKWIGYQILMGIGYSLFLNMPQIAVQTGIKNESVPLAVTTLVFGIFASASIFPTVAQPVNQIIAAGAGNIRAVTTQSDLPRVIQSYNDALTTSFYLPTALSIGAFIVYCGMKWSKMASSS